MKTISILVPCYNEVNNVEPMANRLTEVCRSLVDYNYEIIFRDNASIDGTGEALRHLAGKDNHIRVIMNCRNYGVHADKDTFKGRVKGDILIYIPCDFQEPPELIPEFVAWYEKGYEIVAGQKIGSEEGKIKYGMRQLFYRIIGAFSDHQQIPNMSGLLLVTRRIMELSWNGNVYESFRYFASDLGCAIKLIQYKQQQRRSGKSSYNIWKLLSFSIRSLISTSTIPLRIATVAGAICSAFSFIIGVVYFICKLIWWNRFAGGVAPLLIGMFFLGSIQLLFIGLVGEYVGQILQVVTPATPPLVKELINYENPDNDPYLVKDVSASSSYKS